MQRTRQLDVQAALLAQHLARHPRGLGVGDGVVTVDHLDAVILDQLDQLVGQVERVGLMLEQRVVDDLDLVEVEAFLGGVEA